LKARAFLAQNGHKPTFIVTDAYPDSPAGRDPWILDRRGGRRALDPQRPHSFLTEQEPDETGRILSCATIFLTNRECPWRCVMCDLWQNTLTKSVPPGAIPAQIDFALAALAQGVGLPPCGGQGGPRERGTPNDPAGFAQIVKLYNSGSFFDPRAIPPEDHEPIAGLLRHFGRVVVECHPSLVGESAMRFRDRLGGRLEIAMGLETAHPQVLEKLNKRMTLGQFARAAEILRRHGISLRVFILVQPPFLTDAAEALHWARRSLEFAFDCGATVASLIPTRAGNGALDALAARGDFAPPRLETLEAALDLGLGLRRGRVFADVWELERFSSCAACFPARRERLARTNLGQSPRPPVDCAKCGHAR
jgi:uncharacterized Fe-S cluster-containing MiaB family protein